MNGDGQRFQQIYEEFHEKIFRYLARMAGEADAEDLTQDVFVKVGLALENFRGEAKLSTWVYRIATNTAIDRLRHASTRPDKALPSESPSEENGLEAIPGETLGGEQRVIRQEMNGCIRGIVDTLPEGYRSVIILSELEELTDQEIADVLGVSLEAVKIRLHRARGRLRQKMQEACVLYRDEEGSLACDRK